MEGFGDFYTENHYAGMRYNRTEYLYGAGLGGTSSGSSSDNPTILLKTSNNTPENLARLEAASLKLADAIAKIDAAVETLSDTASVTMPNGSTMSGAQFKTLWHNTDFTISDEYVANFSNGGYGEICRSGSSIVDVLHVTNFENSSYGDENYPGNQGVIFLALHEIGHVAPGGESQYSQVHVFWSQESAQQGTYYSNQPYQGSDYWITNEKWANDFARAMGNTFGFAQDTVVGQVGQGTTGFDWISPNEIHSLHGQFRPG